MTPLSADKNVKVRPEPGDIAQHPVKSSAQIYNGSLVVAALANGYAIAGTDAAGRVFLGVSQENALGTSSDGVTKVKVRKSGRHEFVAVSGAQTDVGKIAYLVDDATVQTAATTHSIPVGVVTRYISATLLEVDITGFAGIQHSNSIMPIGGTPLKVVAGVAAFTTTGTSKTVSTGGLTSVLYAVATYTDAAGPAAADGPLSIACTTGVPTVTSGEITVKRVAGTTSGAAFIYIMFGT